MFVLCSYLLPVLPVFMHVEEHEHVTETKPIRRFIDRPVQYFVSST